MSDTLIWYCDHCRTYASDISVVHSRLTGYEHSTCHRPLRKVEATTRPSENEEVVRLRAELTQDQARCAELEKDAARYRFIRKIGAGTYIAANYYGERLDEETDAAIDAALKETR